MHIVKTLLILSVLNLAFAAPIPRDITGRTPTSSSPPQHDSLSTEVSAPSQFSVPPSESATLSHLSATDGQVPTTEPSTLAHSATDATKPVPVQDSIAGGSKSGHFAPASQGMVEEQTSGTSHGLTKAKVIKNAKIAGAVAAILLAAGGTLKLTQWLQQRSEDDSS